MANRAVSSFSIARSAAYPPFCIVLSRNFFRLRFPSQCATVKLSHSQVFPSNFLTPQFHGGFSISHAHSLVDCVMEELKAMRSMRLVRASKHVELASTAELLEDNPAKKSLQKGCLLEFRKDAQKFLLAVAQKPDGKKNWIVCDQVLVETTTAAC